MRIGICTGGGDCPGLNAVIRALVKSAVGTHHWEAVGIENSLSGLMQRPVRSRPLSLHDVTPILERGGTILGSSSRAQIERDPNSIDKAVEGYRTLGLDALVVVGGEGTQKLASKLIEHGLNIIGIPKTIDNDLPGTEQTVGFSTAVDVASDAIGRLQSTAESHDRIMVLEVMGRDSGYIALHAGMASGANVILLPEIPFSFDAICQKIEERRQLGRLFSVVVCAEGAFERGSAPIFKQMDRQEGPRLGGIGQYIAHELQKRTQMETRVTVLGHIQRGGSPNAQDRVLGTLFASRAIALLQKQAFGRFVVLKDGRIDDLSYRDIPTGERKRMSLESDLVKSAEDIGICLGRKTPFSAL